MFKIEYIYELITGNLSINCYKNILSGLSCLVKKYGWSKNIIVSQTNSSAYWSADDIKELAHQFFEYAIEKRKFDYLNKIPVNYLQYYFTQIFISFVANRISEEQQKTGLSFEKCKELVSVIVKEKYFSKQLGSVEYVYHSQFTDDDVRKEENIDSSLKYLAHIRIPEQTKHYKPLVLMAIEDIFNITELPIATHKLIEIVYKLFDQSAFSDFSHEEEIVEMDITQKSNSPKHKDVTKKLLAGLSKEDAQLISEYLFQSQGEVSLSELAEKQSIPKSTAHNKTESFKKKIAQKYMPENEDDGILFLQNLAVALDELAK
jgi:hypothetical protein